MLFNGAVLLILLLCADVFASSINNRTIGTPSLARNTFKCYVCFWARNDEHCGDANFTVQKAEPGRYMINCLACYKQTYFASKGVKAKVLRGCAQELPHYALRCQYVFNEDNSYMETCACASPYCNTAAWAYDGLPSFWTSVIAVGWMLLRATCNFP